MSDVAARQPSTTRNPVTTALRVFICSRLRPGQDSTGRFRTLEENQNRARALLRDALDAGHAPFVPHLLYTQVLDASIPLEDERAIRAAQAFIEAVDEVWVDGIGGWSVGMRAEIELAQRLGKKIVTPSRVPWISAVMAGGR